MRQVSTQVLRAEGVGEEMIEGRFGNQISIGVPDEDRDTRGELMNDLAAGAAGTAAAFEADGQGGDRGAAFGHGLEDGGPFGADRQPVGGIFNIASREYLSAISEYRCTHAEIGVGCVGPRAGFGGRHQEAGSVGMGNHGWAEKGDEVAAVKVGRR